MSTKNKKRLTNRGNLSPSASGCLPLRSSPIGPREPPKLCEPAGLVADFCSFYEHSDRCCAMSERQYKRNRKHTLLLAIDNLNRHLRHRPQRCLIAAVCLKLVNSNSETNRSSSLRSVSSVCNRCLRCRQKGVLTVPLILTASLLKQRSIGGARKNKKINRVRRAHRALAAHGDRLGNCAGAGSRMRKGKDSDKWLRFF